MMVRRRPSSSSTAVIASWSRSRLPASPRGMVPNSTFCCTDAAALYRSGSKNSTELLNAPGRFSAKARRAPKIRCCIPSSMRSSGSRAATALNANE